jgi:hypothetical protein
MAPSAIQRYFAGLSKNTFLLAISSLFADISTEMLYPVLPVFLTQTAERLPVPYVFSTPRSWNERSVFGARSWQRWHRMLRGYQLIQR